MALGRGLGEILSEVEEAYQKDLRDINSFELEEQGARIEEIAVEEITANPFQPRKHFDPQALQELSDSIVEHGLLQPIVVIEKKDGYLLIAGERRLRAHKLANLTHIRAIVASVEIDDIKLRELALIENIQRENLNAIELANSYAELIEVHDITHDELSSIVHKSRSQITNTMRLLSLSEYAQKQLTEDKLSQGHAKVLVNLDEQQQKIVIDSIIGQKLSVRDTENLVKKYKEKDTKKSIKKSAKSMLDHYGETLTKILPFKTKIKSKSIEITFKNEKEIELFLKACEKLNFK
ncbi:MAG: hypothetical protein RL113_612 [Pseudomonadota bacterium]